MVQLGIICGVVRVLHVTDTVGYKMAFNIQKHLANSLIINAKNSSDVTHSLILLQHKPVYTVGIRDKKYSLDEEERLCDLGADFVRTNRGGLITFHGPGQLIAYPILHLPLIKQTIRGYVCALEQCVIRTCLYMGVEAHTSPHTGVWVRDAAKICAVGIQGRRVTTHGIGLNCNTDLSWFDHIVPCGIEGKTVTSLSQELNRKVTVEETVPHLLRAFREIFQCELIDYDKTFTSESIGKIVDT